MTLIRYFLIGTLLLGTTSNDVPPERTIRWTPEVRLSWDNFQGKPTISRAAAITASGISYQFSSMYKNGAVALDFTVDTFFYPDKSWYRPDLCDSVILGHEQLHFDISELYARKMRRQLSETRFTENVKAEVKAIYRQINTDLNDFQNRYDAETNYSRDREQQQRWNVAIAKELSTD